MKAKRILSLVLALCMCLSFATVASAKSAKDFDDFDRSAWYAEAVSAAVDNDLLYGVGHNRLNPEGNLSRAEMAAIINRSFGAYKPANISKYKDVEKDAWYYEDVRLAVQMGTYEGTSETTMAPERSLTREEAIAVVARALQLDLERYEDFDLDDYDDEDEISKWALPYMRAMVACQYIQGSRHKLHPLDPITRAEFAQIFHNIIGEYITKSGEYTEDREGNLLVRTDDVVLHDMTIDGDLILGNGIADGKVLLSNVTVKGRVVVWGGGTEAVYMNNGTATDELVVCRVDDAVKVIFDKDSTLKVHDKIKVEITDRAEDFEETEVIFYDISGILDQQEDLNDTVEKYQIDVTAPSNLYGLVGEASVKATFVNESKEDTYKIKLYCEDMDKVFSEFELKPGESIRELELAEALNFGTYECTATVTALRDGQEVGTLDVDMTLYVAYLWAA